MTGIVCGSSQCPICQQETTVLIGPCEKCDAYFARHGFYRATRKIPGHTEVQP